MKITIETEKKIYEITFTTGFSFHSALSQKELKKLIKTYPVRGIKEVKEAIA